MQLQVRVGCRDKHYNTEARCILERPREVCRVVTITTHGDNYFGPSYEQLTPIVSLLMKNTFQTTLDSVETYLVSLQYEKAVEPVAATLGPTPSTRCTNAPTSHLHCLPGSDDNESKWKIMTSAEAPPGDGVCELVPWRAHATCALAAGSSCYTHTFSLKNGRTVDGHICVAVKDGEKAQLSPNSTAEILPSIEGVLSGDGKAIGVDSHFTPCHLQPFTNFTNAATISLLPADSEQFCVDLQTELLRECTASADSAACRRKLVNIWPTGPSKYQCSIDASRTPLTDSALGEDWWRLVEVKRIVRNAEGENTSKHMLRGPKPCVQEGELCGENPNARGIKGGVVRSREYVGRCTAYVDDSGRSLQGCKAFSSTSEMIDVAQNVPGEIHHTKLCTENTANGNRCKWTTTIFGRTTEQIPFEAASPEDAQAVCDARPCEMEVVGATTARQQCLPSGWLLAEAVQEL